MQRNMPYFVRLVVDYFYDRMRKTKTFNTVTEHKTTGNTKPIYKDLN